MYGVSGIASLQAKERGGGKQDRSWQGGGMVSEPQKYFFFLYIFLKLHSNYLQTDSNETFSTDNYFSRNN